MSVVKRFIQEEDGIGVVELILILVVIDRSCDYLQRPTYITGQRNI